LPKGIKRLLLLVLCAGLAACNQNNQQHYQISYSDTPPEPIKRYVVGVHPLHNPVRLHEQFQPLMSLASERVDGVEFVLEASRNYAAYNEKLYAGKFDFAIPNPYQTVIALRHGYRVIGKMADDDRFRGIILVRRDSGIDKLSQLKGKKVSFPAPTALAATMMPQMYMQQRGLDVRADIDSVYVGSQESSILNVYLGNVAAGATWPPPWQAMLKERPELEKALKVRWVTDPLPNNSVMVRSDIPAEHALAFAHTLFNLNKSERGRRILDDMAITGFAPASSETYQPVVEFLSRFNREVRPLEQRP